MITLISFLGTVSALHLFLFLCIGQTWGMGMMGIGIWTPWILVMLTRAFLFLFAPRPVEFRPGLTVARVLLNRLEPGLSVPILISPFVSGLWQDPSVGLVWFLRVVFGAFLLARATHLALCLILSEE